MDVTIVACMVHIRRKFIEALKSVKVSERTGTGAQTAVDKLNALFRLDNTFSNLSSEDRKAAREQMDYKDSSLKWRLEEFFAWVDKEMEISLPKSKYGMALEYAHNSKEKALNVLKDGRLELDNNLAERTVKPFVIGRKNWLFANTVNGAKESCGLYSVIQTAKMNGLIPYEYIKWILEELPKCEVFDKEHIDRFLPWSTEVPERCFSRP